jgi:hypothetical protein
MPERPPLDILFPVAALAALTFCVLLLIPFQRFRAAARGQVRASDFALGESERVPPDARLANRNLMNLLEMPVLFYVVCTAFYVTGRVAPGVVSLAWAFVGLRVAHSLIHLTYNRVGHRFLVFAASNIVLLVMWIRFARTVF